jgi:hypothetical protein
MITRKFPITVLSIAGMSLLLFSYPILCVGSGAMLSSFILGCTIPAGMSILGFAVVRWAGNKSNEAFLTAVIGIFLAKMILVGGGLVLLKLFTEIPIPVFVAVLFFYYFLFMILQLRHFQRSAAAARENVVCTGE